MEIFGALQPRRTPITSVYQSSSFEDGILNGDYQ